MKLGIIGLPNVGKSTLFNALTRAGAQSSNYPFCTIDPNIGVVSVPDKRLYTLCGMYNPEKCTPAAIEFVDIAGLVRGASKGEGLGNRFLSHIREVDAIVHVVRCFEDENVAHVDGVVDPMRDVEAINLELIFADLEAVEKRLQKSEKLVKTGDKKFSIEVEALTRVKDALLKGAGVRNMELENEEKAFVQSLSLLTSKPVIYAANVKEDELAKDISAINMASRLLDLAENEGAQVMKVSAKVEEELSVLDEDEKDDFIEALGIGESGLIRLIKKSYALLGLISFFTAGPKEVRAWTVNKGTKAPAAAGKIHTDFERGFIKAEVIGYDELMQSGDMQKAKEKGLVRQEGREYVIKDGDVVLFKFNV